MEELKFGILGQTAVGKTSILHRFTTGHFLDNYDPVVDDSYRKQITVDGLQVKIDMSDVCGPETCEAIRDLFLNFGHAIIVVYAVNDRTSFENIHRYIEDIHQVWKERTVPLLIVGNKSDLVAEREIPPDEALRLATDLDALYLETSAKIGHNIDEIASSLVREIARKRGNSPVTSKKSCCIQ